MVFSQNNYLFLQNIKHYKTSTYLLHLNNASVFPMIFKKWCIDENI